MSKWKVTRYSGNYFSAALISIEMCDEKAWAVRTTRGYCLNKKGRWEFEPMPSSRTEKFLKRCRFPTAKLAMAAADKQFSKTGRL